MCLRVLYLGEKGTPARVGIQGFHATKIVGRRDALSFAMFRIVLCVDDSMRWAIVGRHPFPVERIEQMQTHCSDQAQDVTAVIVGQLLSTAHTSIVDWGSMANSLQQAGETVLVVRAPT